MPALPEKGQVTPSELTAFGIDLGSRHGLAFEMMDMLRFAQIAAQRGLQEKVQSLWYDSNSNTCSVRLAPGLSQADGSADDVRQVAQATLSQFEWNETIQHRQDGH